MPDEVALDAPQRLAPSDEKRGSPRSGFNIMPTVSHRCEEDVRRCTGLPTPLSGMCRPTVYVRAKVSDDVKPGSDRDVDDANQPADNLAVPPSSVITLSRGRAAQNERILVE